MARQGKGRYMQKWTDRVRKTDRRTGNPEMSMKHIHHISWSIRYPSIIRVLMVIIEVSKLSFHYNQKPETYLGRQYERRELVRIDPRNFIQDGQSRKHPKTITNL